MQAPAAPALLAGADPVSTPLIQRGHQLYITDCASCHRPRPPQNYTDDRWREVLPRMEKRARFSQPDAAAVEAYISAARKNSTRAASN